MSKKLAVLLTHGMGDISKEQFEQEASELEASVKRRLGKKYSKIFFEPIYYQDILQKNQIAVFDQMKKESKLSWMQLREFMIYSLSDAATLEHRANETNGVYNKTQQRFFDSLIKAYQKLDTDSKNVIFIAQSLGGEVLSNYIWDAQLTNPKQGIWTKKETTEQLTGPEVEDFARLKTLKVLLTTGCNIPIFVAGKDKIQSINTDSNGYDFEWHNFYDKDDVLGWPLKPLGKFHNANGKGSSYQDAVTKDHKINANGFRWYNVRSWGRALLRHWNPFCHEEYWKSRDFIQYLVRKIEENI